MSLGRKYRYRNVVQIKKTIYTLKAKLVMFMERNLFVKLEQWKNKKKRKSLIIQGARASWHDLDNQRIWCQIFLRKEKI